MLLEYVLLGALQVTSYRSLERQTDSTPFITSIGEHVHPHGVAVSEDMLCPLSKGKTKLHKRGRAGGCKFKKLHYKDWIYVPGYGLKVINDVMHPRHHKSVDLWVKTYDEEKRVGTRRLTVYLVKDLYARIHEKPL
jgi:hypothetical protein